ncbi:hypothetical protein R1sor_000900 [Riccia sorocarpa]|uniref:ABC transporter domain-containing protein n=1 Tax=Riccia sorocarpa TaxID=122646 RepID=A0ABD3GUH5_9MARC
MYSGTSAVLDTARLTPTTKMGEMVVFEEYVADINSSPSKLDPKLAGAEADMHSSKLPFQTISVKEVMDTRKFRFKRRRTIPKALDIHLEFRNLTYTVHQPSTCFGRRRVSPGSKESLQGSITLNSEEVKDNVGLMRSISAYVQQDDLLYPMFIVKETLSFAAELQLNTGSFEKNVRVGEIIKQLHLAKVKDSIIGDEGHRGLEKRRVSIGKEIVHDPLLLFLDEPTSGLDSANAFMVIETLLQRVAETGSIVILSVHQPSQRILKPFHRTKTSVNGLVNEFRHYKAKLVEKERRDKDASSSTDRDPESLVRPMGVRGALAASFVRGKLVGNTGYRKQYEDMDTLVRKFANNRIREVYVLAWRGLLNLSRTPELFLLRWIMIFISTLFLGTIFWQLDHSPLGLREHLSYFTFAISTMYYTCADTLPIFLQECYIFMRETAHDSYQISSYVIAIALINIPYLLIIAITFSAVSFWAVRLAGGANEFLFFLGVIWAAFWAGNSFATFLVAVITNVITGYSLVIACFSYFLLLSGFFITRSRIPSYWIWFHYISAMKYPYEAVLINEFKQKGCYETASEIFTGTHILENSKAITKNVIRHLRPLLHGTRFENMTRSTCLIDGPSILRRQSIGTLTKWECLAITVCFGVFYRLMFYIALRLSGKPKRP